MLDPRKRLVGATVRGPLSLPPGGAHWYALGELGYPDPATFMQTLPLLHGWLDAFEASSGIAPDRTVLGGFSQGAVMTYVLSLQRGRPRFPAAIALSGFIPTVPGLELDLASPLPRFAIGHGIYDDVIGVDWSRRAREVLENAGAEVLYSESPLGHTIDPRFLAQLSGWLEQSLPARV